MRKTKVLPLVAAYAVSLRKEGKTYPEIVALCSEVDRSNSVTLDWCKKELKNVPKEDVDFIEETCLGQITILALMPKGITYVECYKIIAHNHKLDTTKPENDYKVYELYKKYKAKVLKAEGTFFRPSSIQPNKAVQSFKQLLSCANYLYDSVADYVDDYCRDNPETYPSAVRRELASIIFPELKLMGGGSVRCSYLERAVEALTERVVQQEECVVIPAKAITDFDDEYIPY